LAFDKQRVLDSVQEVLAGVPIPGTPTNVIKAGCIQRVIARDGEVTVVVEFSKEISVHAEKIKEQLEQVVSAIDGVERVQILQKAPEKTDSPAPGGPSSVGAQEVPGVKHIVAVASGKGGVGKSTVAVNLAIQLRNLGFSVGLLDADVYGPSTPKMLGTEGSRPQATDRNTIVPLERFGIVTMSIGYLLEEDSPVIWRGPMVTGLLRQFLFQVEWGELDFLILDLPPGTGDAQLTLVQSVSLSGGVIVTTPQDVALLDVHRGIQMFSRVEVPIIGIVENMSVFHCPHCGEKTEIFSAGGGEAAANKFGTTLLGQIPLDPAYMRAGDDGTPSSVLDPSCELSRVMAGVGQQVAAAVGASPAS